MLYRWDANAPEGQRLSAISPDPLGQPGLLGPAVVSDDATSVYFVARGELAPGATRGAPNLYLWKQGQGVRYIATLDPTGAGPIMPAPDSPLWQLAWAGHRRSGRPGQRRRPAAPVRELRRSSIPPMTPPRTAPRTAAIPRSPGERCRQIYLYDAPSGRAAA